jgi:hypothetical protein
MKVNVIYEEKVEIDTTKAFELTIQWLNSLHKVKFKNTIPSKFIEVKQGTMMTSTGHDPNWKKRIRITFYQLEGEKTLIRVEATPLARNVFRVEKLKQSWFEGLFSHLFSLFHATTKKSDVQTNLKPIIRSRFCTNCGKQLDQEALICPGCGIDVN